MRESLEQTRGERKNMHNIKVSNHDTKRNSNNKPHQTIRETTFPIVNASLKAGITTDILGDNVSAMRPT
jgi:hypothetical protein